MSEVKIMSDGERRRQALMFGSRVPVTSTETAVFSCKSLCRFLRLAAAPVFAAMAVLSTVYGNELAAVCTVSTGSIVPLGMGTMYALMSFFHIGPWLELLDIHQRNEGDYET